MESLEFICVITVALLISAWYCLNEGQGADGERGLLALKPDVQPQADESKRRYRIKERPGAPSNEMRRAGPAAPANENTRTRNDLADARRARRRFRRQDEARYRVKDKSTGRYSLRDPKN